MVKITCYGHLSHYKTMWPTTAGTVQQNLISLYNRQSNKWLHCSAAHFLTLWLSQGDGLARLGGVTDTVLVDGAHSEAVLLALDQVKHWEPGRVYRHVQTGQLPAAFTCQGLVQVQQKKKTKIISKALFISRTCPLFIVLQIWSRIQSAQEWRTAKTAKYSLNRPIIHSNFTQSLSP